VLSEYNTLASTVLAAYERYDFGAAHEALYNFCNSTLSAVYLAAVKDRLYCDKPDSPRRRRTQHTLYQMADGLCRLLAPILCHTADEAWRALRKADPKDAGITVHTQTALERFPVEASPAWPKVMHAIDAATKALEEAKAQGIENRLDAGVTLPDAGGELAKAGFNTPEGRADLADLLGVSRVQLDAATTSPRIQDLRGEPRCERSWKRDGTVKQRSDGGMLSDRDAAAVGVG
jgi:isoleucyl-tRNA synthetase